MKNYGLLVALVVGIGVLTTSTDEASGFWGHRSGGSWGGSYGSYGGSWGGSWGGGSCGSWGGRAWGGSWGSRGGGSWGGWGGSYGSYGGSWGSYYGGSWGGGSAGYYGSYGGSVGTSYGVYRRYARTYAYSPVFTPGSVGSYRVASADNCVGTPVPSYESAPQDESAAPVDSNVLHNDGQALIAVRVPADATVYVNGHRTSSEGTYRRYMVPELSTDSEYTFEVRAVVKRDRDEVEQSKVATLRRGQSAELAFNFGVPTDAVETVVTLHVPENAVVQLAGAATNLQGTKRMFTTTSLPRGSSWDHYKVVVSWDQDGRTVTQERLLKVEGGEHYELTFDKESPELVARR